MLGHWFTHNGKWNAKKRDGEFQWEESDWYHLSDCRLDIDSVFPIPLTDDWLKEFEFVFDPKWNDYCKNDMCIGLNKDLGVFTYESSGKVVKLPYVHQLQRLFYVMNNGEELIRKQIKK